MIYLYGLLDSENGKTVPEGVSGVTGDVETAFLPQGHLIYGRHDGVEIPAKRRNLLAHARVLETFQTLGTVLPMRFGMIAASIEEAASLIAEQSDTIREQMTRLNGLVELGLRVSFDRDTALAHQLERYPELARERTRLQASTRHGHFDHAEFGRKLGEALDRHRTDTQRKLLSALKPHVRDLVLRAPEHDSQVLAADILISASAQEDFAEKVMAFANECGFGGGSEAFIKIVGPVPAYNFVRLSLAAPSEQAA